MTESPSRTVAALRSFCGLIDAANLAGAMVAAASCALLAVMLIAEVAATSLFAWSQPWAVEYGAYLCAFTLMAGSGYALRHGTHIRVMLILEYSPRRMRLPVELFCTLGALAVASMLTWGLGELAWRSLVRHSVSYFAMQTPLAWPQAMMAAGALLLALALLARLLRLLIGDPPDLGSDAESASARVQ